MAASYKNPSNLLILRQTACIESFLPIGWRSFISAKVRRHPLSASVWETPNRHPNIKCIVPAFFGDQFGGKNGGLCTNNPPAEEVTGLEAFLYQAAQNCELRLKIKNQNFKKI